MLYFMEMFFFRVSGGDGAMNIDLKKKPQHLLSFILLIKH